MHSHKTETYGLIGYPLGHSFSRNFFTNKFEKEHIDAEYLNFEIPDISLFPSVISENKNLIGLNVTIPYKQQVIPFLDALSEDAAAIGAVNVIRVHRDKTGKVSLTGHNSDVIGFVDSIAPLIKPHHKKALVLGTGGAAKAVHFGLTKLGVEPTYVSRTKSDGILSYDDLTPEVIASHTVIVNATPLGMYPNTGACPPIPYQHLTAEHLCYDVVYNPEETMFMQKSAAYGAVTKNGLEMLHMQAVGAWRIWHK